MEIAKSDERRRHTRVPFSTRIVLTDGHERIESAGSSKDISLRGVWINTLNRLEPGTECDVTIFLTGGGEPVELSMKARVARALDHGLGISFESMDIDTYTHLKNIMLYNSND